MSHALCAVFQSCFNRFVERLLLRMATPRSCITLIPSGKHAFSSEDHARLSNSRGTVSPARAHLGHDLHQVLLEEALREHALRRRLRVRERVVPAERVNALQVRVPASDRARLQSPEGVFFDITWC